MMEPLKFPTSYPTTTTTSFGHKNFRSFFLMPNSRGKKTCVFKHASSQRSEKFRAWKGAMVTATTSEAEAEAVAEAEAQAEPGER